MKRYTCFADRQAIYTLHEQGWSYPQIARQVGWEYETVRKVCRTVLAGEGVDFTPTRLGRPACGPLSTFDPKVRFACLKIKLQHPHWGPDVVQAELAKRAWAKSGDLPCASQIGAYWGQFGDRLVEARAHLQLPGKGLPPAEWEAHACWQIDTQERVLLPGFGLTHFLDVTDYGVGLQIGSFLFPARCRGRLRKVSQPQYQQALRQAFTHWGRPDRLRTDHERVLVAEGDYPFPSAFTLWLVGLGIEHELIQRVTQNGSVERAHLTRSNRLEGYGPFSQLSEWQQLVDYETWRTNAILPSRARGCRRHPPLEVYPQARWPRRGYRLEDESQLFDQTRVWSYLEQGKWLRHTSSKGQFSFHMQKYGLGVRWKNCWVQVSFSWEFGFQVSCPPDKQILKVIPVTEVAGLTYPEIIAMKEEG
jgi:hypothetical protein